MKLLEEIFKTKILNYHALSGGSINQVYKVRTKDGVFCIKLNDANFSNNMFEAERKGLEILSESSNFTIPSVIENGTAADFSYLTMAFIESADKSSSFNADFANRLANLHQNHSDKFGLQFNNFIGPIPQLNSETTNWSDFYRDKRLMPMFEMAFAQNLLDQNDGKALLHFCTQIDNIFPIEKASLLHGDLWSGNYLIDSNGSPCLIDPAVYFGHREMDLSMMKLFGGFDDEIFEIYNDAYPLESGWRDRLKYCQLYPLLVHVVLFGGGYVAQVKRIIDIFRSH